MGWNMMVIIISYYIVKKHLHKVKNIHLGVIFITSFLQCHLFHFWFFATLIVFCHVKPSSNLTTFNPKVCCTVTALKCFWCIVKEFIVIYYNRGRENYNMATMRKCFMFHQFQECSRIGNSANVDLKKCTFACISYKAHILPVLSL